MRTYKDFLLTLIAVFFTFCCFQLSYAQCISFSFQDLHESQDEIERVISRPTVVTCVTYTTDSCLSKKELIYLLGFQEGKNIRATDLFDGLRRLALKEKYETGILIIEPCGEGVSLHIDLVAVWTLKKIDVTGMFFGKKKYASCYPIVPNQIFDEKKHAYGVKKIQDALSDDGYFNSTVESFLSLDHTYKSVAVSIVCNRGSQFCISQVTVSLGSSSDNTHVDIGSLEKKLRKRFCAQLQGKAYSKSLIQQYEKNIQLFLEKEGYYAPEVTLIERIDQTSSTVSLDLAILFHHRCTVFFSGNHYFSYVYLQQSIAPCFFNGIPSSSLVTQKIRHEYCKKGFFAVGVTVDSKDGNFYCDIQEKKRMNVSGVHITADCFLLPQDMIDTLTASIKGCPYDFDTIMSCSSQVSAWYQKHGYPRAYCDGHSLVYDQTGVAICIHVHEGLYQTTIKEEQKKKEPQKIGHIVTVGNDPSVSDYINREIEREKKHGASTKHVIRNALTHLHDLNLFSSVHIIQDSEHVAGARSLIVDYALDDPYEVRLRGGMGLTQFARNQFQLKNATYVFGGTFIAKNRLGNADIVKLEVDWKRPMHSIVGQYKQPWIGEYPIQLHLQGYKTEYKQPGFIRQEDNVYRFVQKGGTASLIYDFISGSCGINSGIEWMETQIAKEQCPEQTQFDVARALNFKPQLLDHAIAYALIEPSVWYDKLDDSSNPSQGSFTLLSLKAMVPLQRTKQASYFVKIFAEHTVYIPIYSLVGAIRVRFGHIFHTDFQGVMPSERFYLGGARSLRSYETDLAPPLGQYCDVSGRVQIVPQGAKSMLNINCELHFPLYKALEGSVFQDLGALAHSVMTDIRAENILAGTGCGLRYATPIGPIRFDIACKWERDCRYMPRPVWFLTFGNAF